MSIILATDGYKLGHRLQYPKGTQGVYATWIPRSNQYFRAADKVVFFGLQYFVKEFLIRRFKDEFFSRPIEEVIKEHDEFILSYLGPNSGVGHEHLEALHKLGYLPIHIKALPEGTASPIGVPQLSIVNTHPDFFWLTNYLETLMSSELFMPSTSATSSYLYKKELIRHAKKTGFLNPVNPDLASLGFSMHDFSMRGMPGLDASIISGMAHLAVFNGSETLPAVLAARKYYNADYTKELVAATVPATEHSVMSAAMADGFTHEVELANYKRLLTEVYPDAAFVSIVSDTRDYADVVTRILPELKDIIMSRPGRLVVRPDSGDPVDIICGAPHGTEFYCKGTYETLWEIFGGTVNSEGYKVLDPHIGIIYGDSITLARQKEIYRRLEEKGFAATNLVLGIGSYTFQGVTRDSLGYALKTSAVNIDGVWKVVYKDPQTAGQNMAKKSLKGFARVVVNQGEMKVIDQVSFEDEGGLMRTVFKDGELLIDEKLSDIRSRIDSQLLAGK